ncbi:MAG: HK97 gp10 family phage protein [Opitutaceae bacterium]|nr:HK97 gp10 family phage protein [Opitutaceae bacterium]
MDGLVETLKGIAADVQADVIADMVKEGAKPIVRSIRARVRVQDGNLKKSIVAVVRKRKRKGTAIAVIGPESGGQYKGGKRLKKGHGQNDAAGPSRYAHLIEFGHVDRKGGRVKEFPFMRPGTAEGQATASAMMEVGFQKGMNRVLAKRTKKLLRQK